MTDNKEVLVAEFDYTGKNCYEISINLREELKKIAKGTILKFTTDNSDADDKVLKWCRTNNQELFLSDFVNGLYVFYIKRKS